MQSLLAIVVLLTQCVNGDWYHQVQSEVLTKQNIWDIIGQEKHVIVDFFTPWCIYCQYMAADWNRIYLHYSGNGTLTRHLTIAKINCDDENTICGQLGVRQFPTILHFAPHSKEPDQSFRGHRAFVHFQQWIDEQCKVSEIKPAVEEETQGTQGEMQEQTTNQTQIEDTKDDVPKVEEQTPLATDKPATINSEDTDDDLKDLISEEDKNPIHEEVIHDHVDPTHVHDGESEEEEETQIEIEIVVDDETKNYENEKWVYDIKEDGETLITENLESSTSSETNIEVQIPTIVEKSIEEAITIKDDAIINDTPRDKPVEELIDQSIIDTLNNQIESLELQILEQNQKIKESEDQFKNRQVRLQQHLRAVQSKAGHLFQKENGRFMVVALGVSVILVYIYLVKISRKKQRIHQHW